MFYRSLAVGALLVLASCTGSKKALKSDYVEQNLDTVNITVSRENPYRGSATKDFDLVDTRLEVKFDYAKQYLYGQAIITLKPHFYPQKELVLDAKQFDIHNVSIMTGENSREALTYTYDSSELKIKLPKEYTRDETLKVYVDYTAKPNERKSGGSAAITEDKGLYFINPLGTDTNKPIQIWTQGETESNSCWFPTIDKPDQKCTEEIYITHLKKYVSLSNGELLSTVPVNDSLVVDHWKSILPFSPYLVMMAIGDFAVIRDHWRDVPVDYYVEKEYAPYARQIFGATPEMIEFFSQKLGFDFPWAKYAQVVVRDYVSGAMENTSATLHGEFLQRNTRQLLDETYEDVISHELFHQWFGDLVTPESWSNIPLSESFATYGEYLWDDYKYGHDLAEYKEYRRYRKYMEESLEKNVDLIRYYYNDREDMFDAHSYEKGGMVLHYLRKCVGDEAFFKALELYLKNNQFKNVEINNLRLAFEEVTGKDMNWFFNEWFLNSGHPVLNISYGYDDDSIYVTVQQKHNTDKDFTYTLPFKIGVWYGSNMSTYDFVLKKKSQRFAIKANGKPNLVDFDPEYAVLCERTDNKTVANYIFEYYNAPNFREKYEALKKLQEVQKDNKDAKDVLLAALNDKFYYLREYALNSIDLPKDQSDTVYGMVQKLAKSDNESAVRKTALDKLSKTADASKYLALFENAVGDSSYEVAAEALKAVEEADPKRAMELAKQFENDKESSLVAAVADVYSKEADANYQRYFETKLRHATGFAKYSLFFYYANFLTRMDKGIVLTGIKTIEEQANTGESHFMLGAAKGALKRIIKSFDDKKKSAQAELANTTDKASKVGIEEQLNDYDIITGEAQDATDRLNRNGGSKKGN